jgi:hypothetical protein
MHEPEDVLVQACDVGAVVAFVGVGVFGLVGLACFARSACADFNIFLAVASATFASAASLLSVSS